MHYFFLQRIMEFLSNNQTRPNQALQRL
jgi:hypothetical protein